MRVLVLGGTQFVGKALVEDLVARGWDVSVLTRGIRPLTVEGVRRWYRADRRDPSTLDALAGERFDAVLDVSAYAAEDVGPVLEKPRCGYALSIVRPAYVYGPGNNLLREAYLFDRLERGLPVPVPSGGARTQFALVGDVARMLAALAEPVDWDIETFNCAHPEEVDWDGLVRAAARAAGVEPRIAHVGCGDASEARTFFPFRDCTYLLDVRKAARFGMPRPETPLDGGMERTYAWYRRERPRLADPKMSRVEEALRLASR